MGRSSSRRTLWAPWRIEYIRRGTAAAADGCFLCHAATATAAAAERHWLIARGRRAVVLLNRYPYSPGHLLIAPCRHRGDLAALTAAERAEMLELVVRAQTATRAALKPHGFNFGCNLGHEAGAAVVDHVHFHLVPRWRGDTNFMPVLADTGCLPQALAETAKLLRQHWPGKAAR